MSVITNTTVIINFAAIGRLDLLRRLFGAIHLPTEVYAEILDGQAEGYSFLNKSGALVVLSELSGTGKSSLVQTSPGSPGCCAG